MRRIDRFQCSAKERNLLKQCVARRPFEDVSKSGYGHEVPGIEAQGDATRVVNVGHHFDRSHTTQRRPGNDPMGEAVRRRPPCEAVSASSSPLPHPAGIILRFVDQASRFQSANYQLRILCLNAAFERSKALSSTEHSKFSFRWIEPGIADHSHTTV